MRLCFPRLAADLNPKRASFDPASTVVSCQHPSAGGALGTCYVRSRYVPLSDTALAVTPNFQQRRNTAVYFVRSGFVISFTNFHMTDLMTVHILPPPSAGCCERTRPCCSCTRTWSSPVSPPQTSSGLSTPPSSWTRPTASRTSACRAPSWSVAARSHPTLALVVIGCS